MTNFADGPDSLLARVRRRLSDFIQVGSAKEYGDGAAVSFKLPDENIVPLSVTCTVDGVETQVTFDQYSGWVTFDTAPGENAEILISYRFYVWSDEIIKEAINAGTQYLYGPFYGVETDTITTNGQDDEYELPEGVERVIRVQLSEGASQRTLKDWETFATGLDQKVIRFRSAPPNGTLSVSYTMRATPMVADNDTLEATAGLPTRAAECVVLYACWSLLTQRLPLRIRDDIIPRADDSSWYITPAQYANAADRFRVMLELQTQRSGMRPQLNYARLS